MAASTPSIVSEPDPRPQAGLVEVELALDLPQRLGRERRARARISLEHVALGVDHLRQQPPGVRDVGLAVLVVVALEPRLQALEPRAVAVAQALDDVVGRLALELVEPLERRLR